MQKPTSLTTQDSVTGLRGLRFDSFASVLVVVALWASLSWWFGSGQELWVDETTQLRGLSLHLGDMTAWLAGVDQNRFDVPGDRMPPLSYWLGWLWVKMFGLTDGGLRVLSAMAVGVAAITITSTARRAWGVRAGYVSGLAFVLSPNIITMGVEIRAYPFLLLFSACAFSSFLSVLNQPRQRAWSYWAVALWCTLACYTHFFGLLLTGGIMLSALVYNLANGRGWRAPVFAAAAVLVGSSGIVPFVHAAVQLTHNASSTDVESRSLTELLKGLAGLLFRVFGGHPSGRIFPVFASLVLIGTALLVLSAVFRVTRSASTWPLLCAIGSGVVVASLVDAVAGGFNALAITYNCWMLPAVAMLAGAGAANTNVRARWVRLGSVGGLLLGSAGSAGVLVTYLPHFTHTAGDRVARQIREAGGSSRIAVVLDAGSSWGNAYFPLRYRFGNDLKQYLADSGLPSESASTTLLLPSRTPTSLPSPATVSEIWVLSGITMDTDALAAAIRGRWSPPPRPNATSKLLANAGWTASRTELLPAFGGILVTRYGPGAR